MMPPIVVKIGGSLLDWDRSPPRIRTFLDRYRDDRLVVVCGGGKLVDAIRELDRIHGLGEEVSHHLAMETLDFCANRPPDRPGIGAGRIVRSVRGLLGPRRDPRPRPSAIPGGRRPIGRSVAAFVVDDLGLDRRQAGDPAGVVHLDPPQERLAAARGRPGGGVEAGVGRS